MKCSWYVQTNLNQNGAAALQSACEALDKPFHEMRVIPFTTRMPVLKAQDPFVLVGSTTLSRNAIKSRKYRRGIFFDPKNFRPETYAKHYGGYYLNYDTRTIKMKDIGDNDYSLDEKLFIRSNDDSKNISGGTVLFEELLEVRNNTQAHFIGGDIFTPESEICIAACKPVGSEWRLVFLNGKIIASSRYRPSIESYVPFHVLDFARQRAQEWSPNDVFVMDVCSSNNELKVVECNCFNGSGFYACNITDIVREVSAYQESKYDCN